MDLCDHQSTAIVAVTRARAGCQCYTLAARTAAFAVRVSSVPGIIPRYRIAPRKRKPKTANPALRAIV